MPADSPTQAPRRPRASIRPGGRKRKLKGAHRKSTTPADTTEKDRQKEARTPVMSEHEANNVQATEMERSTLENSNPIVSKKRTGRKAGRGTPQPQCDRPSVLSFYRRCIAKGVPAIKTEYLELKKVIPPGIQATVFNENVAKNRYRDVICLDATRVILANHTTDYIHASWVGGSNGEKAFICAQAPLSGTIVDFWAMVWQEECVCIAMLCDVVENGKEKCAQYWPKAVDSSCSYGEYTVTTTGVKQHHLACRQMATISDIELTKEGFSPRTCKHVQWAEWPDRGIPSDAKPVLKLRKYVQDLGAGQPIVVHCSAGIGRTGTLVVIDICMNVMDTRPQEVVNVEQTLRRVREQRMHSVQTDLQYVFIHKVLLDYCVLRHRCDVREVGPFNRQINAIYQTKTT